MGGTRWHLGRHAPFPAPLFPRNSNSIGKQTYQDPRNRITSDIKTNEAFPDRETNPVGLLTNSKDIIQKGRKSSRRSGWARLTPGQVNEAWALYKSNPSRVSWVDIFQGPIHGHTQLDQSQLPLLEIHLLKGYCSLSEPISSRPAKPVQAPKNHVKVGGCILELKSF